MSSQSTRSFITLGVLLGLLLWLGIRAFNDLTYQVGHPPPMSAADQEANDSAGTGPLVEAEQRWSARAPSSYRFVLNEQCFCPSRPALEVTVRDGAIIRSRPVLAAGQDSSLLRENVPEARTIPDLFAEIRGALGDPDWGVRAVYDTGWGFPVSFSTGHHRVTDVGRGVKVSEFRPLAR